MALSSVPEAAWTLITTTTEDTSFQNRGGSVMYVTTQDTASLGLNDGISVPQGFAVVIAAGKDVSVCFPQGSGAVHYMGV